jgi:hypothetical protein
MLVFNRSGRTRGRNSIRLFRTYEIGSSSLSNSYARVSTFLASNERPAALAQLVAAAPRANDQAGATSKKKKESQMLVLINTISIAIARTLARAASRLSDLQRSLARTRADRARIEAELFHSRYHLSSKNDDDLPLVR